MSAAPSAAGALSQPGEDDLAFLRELAAPQPASRDSGATAGGLLDEAALTPWREHLLSAALLDGFEPLALMPGIKEDGLQALLRHCTVTQKAGSAQWRLGAAARSALLSEAARHQGLRAAAAGAERQDAGDIRWPLSRALRQLVQQGIPSDAEIAGAGRAMWPAYQAALPILRDSGLMSEAKASRLESAIVLAELLEPLRFLIRWNPEDGSDAFIGRDAELRELRKFVDVLASRSMLESVQRGLSRLTSEDSRALVMSGIGGVGKSTLVAKFLVDHAAASHAEAGLVFSYLDFDRAAISAAQPATLLLEILRQLACQLLPSRTALEQLRAQVQHNVATVAALPSFSGGDSRPEPGSLPRELIDRSQMNLYLGRLAQAVHSALRERVILVVLDTFEEVQLLGDEATVRVEGFVEDLLRMLPNLRLLVVGRDEASGFFRSAERLPPLKGFGDKPSRRAFLESRGVPRALSEQIAAQAGGRPLALLLAARLVSEFKERSLELGWAERFKARLDETLTEGILYERILQHIPDEQLRRIAHPGLVLRRLDAEAIVQVLAPTLGLGELSLEDAEQLMAVLRRQRDLVRVEPDGSVVHRADVRSQMLQLMTLRDPRTVERLHHAAAAYYRSRQWRDAPAQVQTEAGVEEIYHLLCLGQDLDRVLALWSPAARLALGRSVDEIPDPHGRLALRVLLDRTVGVEESTSLPPRLAQIYAENATRTALAEQQPERALRILDTWKEALPAARRSQLLALALDRNGRWKEARHCFELMPPAEDAPADAQLAWADFIERAALQRGERQRLSALILPRLAGLRPTTGVTLAVQRLLVRAGPISQLSALAKHRVLERSTRQMLEQAEDALHPWWVTLGRVVPRPGLHRLQELGDSELQKRQAGLLLVLCSDSTQQVDRVIRQLCEALLSSNRQRALARVEKQEPWIEESYLTVLCHLMRPSTPQWYLPFAVLLRGSTRHADSPEELLDLSLAQRLSVSLPRRAASTRALADVLRELDQLGLLNATLKRSAKRWASGDLRELMRAYQDWRADLMRIDQVFEPRLQALLRA